MGVMGMTENPGKLPEITGYLTDLTEHELIVKYMRVKQEYDELEREIAHRILDNSSKKREKRLQVFS